MNILVDMNLSPMWREELQLDGHEVSHWSDVGNATDPDLALVAWARQNGFVILTLDLDFGMLLRFSGAVKPSVIQIRSDNVRPKFLGKLVRESIVLSESELGSGAFVTLYSDRFRMSMLPLQP